jgi:predicted nucleic acid-binding protein
MFYLLILDKQTHYCTIVINTYAGGNMDVVIDTSALIAVIVGEPERNRIVEFTTGSTLIGPGSIPWEIGNAFSAMFKQNRLTLEEARKGLVIFDSIPLRYIKPDFVNALKISKQAIMYAYDAYFLDCAINFGSKAKESCSKFQSRNHGGLKCKFIHIQKPDKSSL